MLASSVLESGGDNEFTFLHLPEVELSLASRLLEVMYSGSVEASLADLRDLILLARELRVEIPVSEELLELLEIPQLEDQPEVDVSAVKVEEQEELPKPPPLKRIADAQQPPHLEEMEDQQDLELDDGLYHPQQQSKDYLCPFCNSKYNNPVAFKNHLKFHESEALRKQRSQMMNEMVATCFSEHPFLCSVGILVGSFFFTLLLGVDTNVYTCAICHSTYSHPGNFKQHLGKHERETGAVTTYFQQKDPEHAHMYASPQLLPSGFSAGLQQRPRQVEVVVGGGGGANSYLSDALRSSLSGPKSGDVGGIVVTASSSASEEHHCDVCGRTFKHSGNYKQHMASHMRVSNIAFPSHLRSALDGSNGSSRGRGNLNCHR